MKQITIILLFASFSCFAQDVKVIKIQELEKRIHNNSDTTYIVNFWATWCAPCVKELPDLDSISRLYSGSKVKVLLITLDFKEDLQTKVTTFLKTHKLHPEILLLDEVNGNYFIPKVSDKWTGAIPATLVLNNKKGIEHFFEKKITYELLKTEIENSIH